MTEEQYNLKSNSRAIVGNCTEQVWASDCRETTYKRFMFLVSQDVPGSNEFIITVTNQWKIIPSTKSYDNIGVYFRGYSPTDAHGYQYYRNSSSTEEQYIYYSYRGNNMSIDQNGHGISISQNIVDNVSGSLKNELWIRGVKAENMSPKVYASYQHSVVNISLSTAKDFTFSPSGMGSVFDWNSSYSNWDNMQGLCHNQDPTDNFLWTC